MPHESEADLREAIVAAVKRMSASGLSPGRSGNASARWGDGMLITASGVAYDEIIADDGIVFVDSRGEATGRFQPSTEWRFHKAVYDIRPDRHAVIHCHSRYATALACARKPIPAFHYMVAVAGGSEIPLVPYATFGTEELARNVASALATTDACLLANHGQVAIGANLTEAFDLAQEVEALAAQYVAVLAVGEPHILSEAEMTEVLKRFETYGKPRN